MDPRTARDRLVGCYVTIPTLFRDPDLSVDTDAIRRHVRFLIDGGLTTGNAVLLAGGAAGDFSTMTFEERIHVAEAVVDEAAGRVPIAIGGQTTSTAELVRLVRSAERLGAAYVQVSPPFYFEHTEGDFYEHVVAGAEAGEVGLILYNTFWTSLGMSAPLVEKLAGIPNVVGLKWATPDTGAMAFEQIVTRFADRFSIIDNQMRYVISHMLGARSIEIHVANYWPQWAVGMWRMLERGDYLEAQRELVRVAMPFMALWTEMESFTSGDGYLDKLCMELVGLPSSRSRPPTRDVRPQFRERAREMLLACGVPRVVGSEPGLPANPVAVS
jgi:dihydrodipicolinate synthase/N-acetylneuraminate lyase